ACKVSRAKPRKGIDREGGRPTT
ncbi:hypothetical protein CCACVL1_01759, partial [Corchorus capsularis]